MKLTIGLRCIRDRETLLLSKGMKLLTVPSTALFSANPLFAAQPKDSVGQITNDRFRLSNGAIREEKGSESIET